jgi:hypothetical protein
MTSMLKQTEEHAIVDGLAEARLMIAYARGRLVLDRPVDVLPIQRAVDDLCAAVAALGPDRARPFMTRLSLVDDDLASLVDELTPAGPDARMADDAASRAGAQPLHFRP